MASTQPNETKGAAPEEVERIESQAHDNDLKNRFQDLDQFGSHKRQDPAEIALVRKMDWYIIVSRKASVTTL
jgi:hypothetical protein